MLSGEDDSATGVGSPESEREGWRKWTRDAHFF